MAKPKTRIGLTQADVLQACGPLSADRATDSRLRRIEEDFADGFAFLQSIHKVVSVFGSATVKENDPAYKSARKLAGKLVTEQGFTIVTGGGPGIMEAANRGAQEAGGISAGLTIELRNHQPANDYIDRRIDFHYFFARKVALAFAARAYIFFAGGYGTLNEFFELLMLVQTEKIQPIPIICVGSDYWRPLHNLMQTLLKDKFGVISQNDLDLFTTTDDLDAVVLSAANAGKRI